MMCSDNVIWETFKALSVSADKKFSRVQSQPATCHSTLLHKAFKSYTKLWKYQLNNRATLLKSGLKRSHIGEIASKISQLCFFQYTRTSEARYLFQGLKRSDIGEIASRIAQLCFFQYTRTSEARYLFQACIFYEAVLERGYFNEGERERGIRFKELRFCARFLLVGLLLDRRDMVDALVERFQALVDDSIKRFRETNFKEWKLVLQEIERFLKADTKFTEFRPLRYCAMFDTHPSSYPYVARFHAKKLLKFRDAVLTSYHRNEVKYAELTLDTFRMLQCLEWEPSGSFFQKKQQIVPRDNGAHIEYSASSGLIDINLAADMTDPNLPPNPRKAVLYRSSVTQLIAVIATICEELPPESVILIHISASGKGGHSNVPQKERSGALSKSSNANIHSHTSQGKTSSVAVNHVDEKGSPVNDCEDGLWLGPNKTGGSNWLYPGDIIPFTRKPLFLVIDSDNSRAFKVLHGAERGEIAALLLSPLEPTIMNANSPISGSQFTLFLTDPLQAFCQLVGHSYAKHDADVLKVADKILSTTFAQWEVILCKSTKMHLVWAQVLPDPFLRRLILRFIFCRSVLALSCREENSDKYLPTCLPELPDFVSPTSDVVQSCVFQLASHLDVSDCFSH